MQEQQSEVKELDRFELVYFEYNLRRELADQAWEKEARTAYEAELTKDATREEKNLRAPVLELASLSTRRLQ